mmetsp:Transcript_47353/g.144031  ORF Transcript_47353/g.144031 Transcript_47353/m.144031 type:complete len:253 (+) Transcript_47353:473-1231(+)
MFRGTEMSTSITPFARPCRSSGLRIGSLLAVAANTTSLSATTSIMASNPATLAFLPPRPLTMSSSNTACALSTERLTTVTLASGFLLNRASRRSRDILPAPTMQTLTLLAYFRRSGRAFAIISSTAALDTETEPLPILVFVRTTLPMRMPAFSIFAMILPPAPWTLPSASAPSRNFSMACSWQALTWARICASPRTRESRPELTSKRWLMASSPVCVNKNGPNSSLDRPDFWRKKACTISMAGNFFSSGEEK